MLKKDCEINNWTATWLKTNYDWISNATADCEENYDIDDVVFSATTISGDIIPKKLEVKSIKGGFQLKYDGEWNDWFSTDNPNGIIKKMNFSNTPPPSMDIIDLPDEWNPEIYGPTDNVDVPEEWKNKHIYFLNAEDKYHRTNNSKAYKVANAEACLTYVAPDGLILFNPSNLKKAFLGYCWYNNKSHTEEYNKDNKSVYELKAVYSLEDGVYKEANPPRKLFEKH